MTKNVPSDVCQAKIQIRLRECAVWSESSPGTFWIAKDANSRHVDNKDSDQTEQMHRLIWVFDRRTCQKVQFLTLWLKWTNLGLVSHKRPWLKGAELLMLTQNVASD